MVGSEVVEDADDDEDCLCTSFRGGLVLVYFFIVLSHLPHSTPAAPTDITFAATLNSRLWSSGWDRHIAQRSDMTVLYT